MPYNVCILASVDKNNPNETYERPIAVYAGHAGGGNHRLVSLWNFDFESANYNCQCCFFDFHDNNSCNED